jgi:predicted Zn-dependent protease
MKKIFAILCIGVILSSGCSRVPLTGRKQAAWIPTGQMQSMAYSQYSQFMQQNRPIMNGADAQMVKKVGQRISSAVTSYLQSKNLQKRVAGFKWEYNLVKSPQANAWCMPGGKIAVYTGILPITKTEAGLAAVMGHEVAHAIAKHGNERMTKQLGIQAVGAVGQAAISVNNPQQVNTFNQMYGIAGQLKALRWGRKQELEADEMGMIFMAKAGYNPQEAIELWRRMGASSKGQKPPEFMSTHPHEATRIEALQKILKKAQVYYRPNNRN